MHNKDLNPGLQHPKLLPYALTHPSSHTLSLLLLARLVPVLMPREEGTQRRNKGSRPMTLKNTLAARGIYSYSFQAGFWLLFTLISAKQLELRPWLDPKVWSVWDDGQEWTAQLLTAVSGCCTFVFTCYSNDLKLNFEWINYFQAGFITKFIKFS